MTLKLIKKLLIIKLLVLVVVGLSVWVSNYLNVYAHTPEVDILTSGASSISNHFRDLISTIF